MCQYLPDREKGMMKRLFAIGDIHGCFDQFRELVEVKIKAEPKDRIILLGDYIDRGYHVKQAVDYIIDLQDKHFDIVVLRGNHEQMMLEAIRTGDMTAWMWNGAETTLHSFGILFPGELNEKYKSFFESLLWYYEYNEYLFVHAGFNDDDPFSDTKSMIWTRREVYSNPLLKNRTIVHGHTPITADRCVENVETGNNVINIDTGAVYTEPGYGILTAIELNSRDLYFA